MEMKQIIDVTTNRFTCFTLRNRRRNAMHCKCNSVKNNLANSVLHTQIQIYHLMMDTVLMKSAQNSRISPNSNHSTKQSTNTDEQKKRRNDYNLYLICMHNFMLCVSGEPPAKYITIRIRICPYALFAPKQQHAAIHYMGKT